MRVSDLESVSSGSGSVKCRRKKKKKERKYKDDDEDEDDHDNTYHPSQDYNDDSQVDPKFKPTKRELKEADGRVTHK